MTLLTPAPLAVMVIVLDAGAAVPSTLTVTVLLVDPVAMLCGAKLMVTPDGAPDAASATAPGKPPLRVRVMVVVDDAPRAIVPDDALEEIEMAGVAGGVTGSSLPPPPQAAISERVDRVSRRRRITVLVDSG